MLNKITIKIIVTYLYIIQLYKGNVRSIKCNSRYLKNVPINALFNTVEAEVYTLQYNYSMAISRWKHNNFYREKNSRNTVLFYISIQYKICPFISIFWQYMYILYIACKATSYGVWLNSAYRRTKNMLIFACERI